MKNNLIPALRLTLVLATLCVGVYPAIVWGIAQLMPNHGKGEMVRDKNGKPYFANIGQKFDSDKYFNSRPSAVGYNADASGGSNQGPSNPGFLKEVQARVNAFKAKNPGEPVPVDMVTASGSGLDPDISLAAANAQIGRIARARNVQPGQVRQLVQKYTEHGFLAPTKINVLKLNIALDEIEQ